MKAVAVSRLLLLLAAVPSWPVAQAFQLQNNNNNDHHQHHQLVSPLTHPPHHQPDQLRAEPLNNIKLLSTSTKKKKKNLLSSSSNTQTAAVQINRTVNRNTKNRQNHSKCSLEAPHSTLLDITTSSSSSSHHHHDGDNDNEKKNIQRSLRQLGITIASTFLFMTQARVKVANAAAAAAAAATPLIVTHHPTGIGSTAITPLLSTTSFPYYHGLTIVPFQGLSPAMGQIIMSFAYVIIALGVSHALGSLAEGGHVKLLRVLAWQNLADADADDDGSIVTPTTTTSSSIKGSTTINNNKNNKGGVVNMNIQGLFSRYTYMVQLITSEIRKAYRIGQHYNNNNKKKKLIPATTTTTTLYSSSSSPSSSKMLSSYASNLNQSFQQVYTNNDEEEDDDGSTMNWKEYSKLLFQKKKKKKKKGMATSSSSSRWSRVLKNGGTVYNKFAMMFERVAKSDDSEAEAEATKKATELFQQKQFEQHHHHVHVPRSPFEESSYLDSLAKFGTEEDLSGSHKHDYEQPTKGYLDTLSDVARKSTWDVYKDQVENAKKEMTTQTQDEVDYLKEELVHVQSLLQDEQAMYQTSNQALNLVVEAQNEELKHARTAASTTDTEGQQHSTTDELKEFDIKAKEYDEAIKESKAEEVKASKDGSASTAAPHKWIFWGEWKRKLELGTRYGNLDWFRGDLNALQE